MKRVTCTIIIMLSTIILFSQNSLKYSGFSISYSEIQNNLENPSFEENLESWKEYGGLFTRDLQIYDHMKTYSSTHPSYNSINIIVHLSFGKEQFDQPGKFQNLNFGINFINKIGNYHWLYTNEVYRIDTLTWSSVDYYVDSLYYRELTILEKKEKLSIFAQYEFSTNPDRKFSLYAGPTISVGSNFNASVSAGEEIKSYRKRYPNYYSPINYEFRRSEIGELDLDQKEPLPNEWELGLFLPVGFRFKLSKADNWLGMIYFFAEGQIGVRYLTRKNKGNETAYTQNISLGVRFWDYPFD